MILERRYVVLKISDIERYIPAYKWKLMQELICDDIEKKRKEEGRAPLECICIERDWPEYEPVLKMLSGRVDEESCAPRYPWHSTESDLAPKTSLFRQYRRKGGLSEMRPYIKGEDLTGVSVSVTDNPDEDMGMIDGHFSRGYETDADICVTICLVWITWKESQTCLNKSL